VPLDLADERRLPLAQGIHLRARLTQLLFEVSNPRGVVHAILGRHLDRTGRGQRHRARIARGRRIGL
jgi:hypothetical protein